MLEDSAYKMSESLTVKPLRHCIVNMRRVQVFNNYRSFLKETISWYILPLSLSFDQTASYDSPSAKHDLKNNIESPVIIIWQINITISNPFEFSRAISFMFHVALCTNVCLSLLRLPERIESIHVSLTELCGSKLLQFLLPFDVIDFELSMRLYLANKYSRFILSEKNKKSNIC